MNLQQGAIEIPDEHHLPHRADLPRACPVWVRPSAFRAAWVWSISSTPKAMQLWPSPAPRSGACAPAGASVLISSIAKPPIRPITVGPEAVVDEEDVIAEHPAVEGHRPIQIGDPDGDMGDGFDGNDGRGHGASSLVFSQDSGGTGA